MLVSRYTFGTFLHAISTPGLYALDTETTGLRPYQGDRLFSIIIAGENETFYLNFQPYPSFVGADGVCDETHWLGDEHMGALREFLAGAESHEWALHNAKYDLSILAQEGITLAGTIHCTMAIGRVVRNDLKSYSLDSLGAFAGLAEQKLSVVKKYCDENGCYERVHEEGKKAVRTVYKYHMVPLEIMQPYAETDARVTRALALWEKDQLQVMELNKPENVASPIAVFRNERALTPVVYEMERQGLLVDVKFCEEAVAQAAPRAQELRDKLSAMVGRPFVDSGKFLGQVFLARGIKLPPTATGVAQVSEEVFVGIDDDLARGVLALRGLSKAVNTYFRNFLQMRGHDDRIHCDLVQSGTVTGRFSCRDPNLQNLTKEDEDAGKPVDELFPVRRSFVPTPGFCFFLPDYSQMEYRMMVDYAQEMQIIEQVIAGVDLHQATANLTGLSRSKAKTFNFGTLYGSGLKLQAKQLGATVAETRAIKEKFFRSLPRVAVFLRRVMHRAETTGYITNWLGRRCYFANPRDSYIAPNHLIQGGAADVVKLAMVQCAELLRLKKARSRMVMTIHDEIVFELHESELDLAPDLCRIMETAFPSFALPLKVDPSYSWASLGDKIKGMPQAP